jgi:hypothetical protein
MGHVFLIVACHIWFMTARERHILALTCYHCGREGIAFISLIENPHRRLRIAIDNVTKGFVVLEHGQSFECVACNLQAHVK